MAVNPSLRPEHLNNPTQRANEINDPQFQNQQGYFGYDLTHGEYMTTRFGEVSTCLHLETVPADRIIVNTDCKTILNQINGNFLSTINQYVDSFYVPLRSVFPNNYEKLIPNPTKGDDLPNSALPQFPLLKLFADFLYGSNEDLEFVAPGGESFYIADSILSAEQDFSEINSSDLAQSFGVPRVRLTFALLFAYVLSRGQLLDFLGIQLDSGTNSADDNLQSQLQVAIDGLFSAFFGTTGGQDTAYNGYPMSLTEDLLSFDDLPSYSVSGLATMSSKRQALADIFERGEFFWYSGNFSDYSRVESAYNNFVSILREVIPYDVYSFDYRNIDSMSDPFSSGYFFNIGIILAYQQSVAHYFVNNTVDNIFTSELFMQNLRSVMFPAVTLTTSPRSSEPVFDYNGVYTEYDLITTGAFCEAFSYSNLIGAYFRAYVWITLMLINRRSLRFGDYFATARPNMLAVGDIMINVAGGNVSPIDVTQNLLKQRYLNAANYVGSGILQWYASFYGVTPSDTGTFPRFLAHRKIELQNQITNNTSNEQGKQTTNIVGHSSGNSFDVFIDDFGYILSTVSYDVLPVYLSGIDSTYRLADRFDFFNPMLQNIGDEPILFDELSGNVNDHSRVFGYTMRDSKYKFKKSRAHGAFCNSLPGFLVKYPYGLTSGNNDLLAYSKINPDFIRDKAFLLDSVSPKITGSSPADYYHFVGVVLNEVHAARKIQATPPVLF